MYNFYLTMRFLTINIRTRERLLSFILFIIFRVEIGVHHGPDGGCSLLRSIGALGSRNLNALMAQSYPNLVYNFHDSSAATILAVSLAVKKRISVYENMDRNTTGPIATFAQFLQDFDVMDPLRNVNLRK